MTNNLTRGVDVEDATATRTCIRCKAAKAVSEFYLRSGKPMGACKACILLDQKKYRQENKAEIQARRQVYFDQRKHIKAEYDRHYNLVNAERLRAKSKAWYQANKQRHRETQKAWAERNAEAVRAAAQRRYQENKEDRLARGRAWREANIERARLLNAEAQRRRRARIAGLSAESFDPDELWTGYCGLCGESMDWGIPHPDPMSKSLDHVVPIALGGCHTKANVQWAHLRCNIEKGARLL